MDHDQIISILHMTDHIRGQLKVRFPQEMDEQELEAYHKFRAEHTASRKAAAAAGADGGEAASATAAEDAAAVPDPSAETAETFLPPAGTGDGESQVPVAGDGFAAEKDLPEAQA
jgi:hypothetical protein